MEIEDIINPEDIGQEEQTKLNTFKEFSGEEKAEQEVVLNFLERKELVGKTLKAKILRIGQNEVFGKTKKIVYLKLADSEGWLDLNKKNWNFLVYKFGGYIKDFIGKEVSLTATEKDFMRDNQTVKGVMVVFS